MFGPGGRPDDGADTRGHGKPKSFGRTDAERDGSPDPDGHPEADRHARTQRV